MTCVAALLPPASPAALGGLACVRDPDIVRGYLQDVSRLAGWAERLYRPGSEESLSALMAQLSADGTPVTVVARQTSTTGASVPEGGAIVLLDKLSGAFEVDPSRLRASAESGILLGDFQRALERQGLLYPPDPTSRNECTLGGSVACNASGARTFRYGATRGWVEALRVVLADGHRLTLRRGDVLSSGEPFVFQYPDGRRLEVPCPAYALPPVKHAAGYHALKPGTPLDLLDLFIGSEGTLGIITWVEVRILPLPEKVLSFLACFPSEQAAFACVRKARAFRQAGGEPREDFQPRPRCIEWLDGLALKLVRHRFPEVGLPETAQAALFFEQECLREEEDATLEGWLEVLAETGALTEHAQGVLLADSEARLQLLYDMRHAVPAGVNEQAARNGMPKLGTDLAVPDEALEAMMALYARGVKDVAGQLPLAERLAVLREVLALDPENAPELAVVQLDAMEDELKASQGRLTEPARKLLDARSLAMWQWLKLPSRLDSATFGHIGDNHVHVNLLPTSPGGLVAARALYAHWTREAIRLGGTVSAEHGIGKIKRKALTWLLGEDALRQMQAVKEAMDPGWILGRGNLMTPPQGRPGGAP